MLIAFLYGVIIVKTHLHTTGQIVLHYIRKCLVILTFGDFQMLVFVSQSIGLPEANRFVNLIQMLPLIFSQEDHSLFPLFWLQFCFRLAFDFKVILAAKVLFRLQGLLLKQIFSLLFCEAFEVGFATVTYLLILRC